MADPDKIKLLNLLSAAKANGDIKNQVGLLMILLEQDARAIVEAFQRIEKLYENMLEPLLEDTDDFYPFGTADDISEAVTEMMDSLEDIEEQHSTIEELLIRMSKVP